MNADGSGQTDVSNDGAGNYTASWTNGSGNMSPVASAGGTYSGTIGQNVPFHGNNSYDPDGTIVSYSWNFSDGGSASGINPTHAYTANGSYTLTLTVTDNLGAQASVQTTANISTSSSDQFAQTFLYWGLGRTPNGDENGYWSDIMRAAYPQGQTSMLMAMKEFGFTVFESQEYAQRNRSNHDFVYDLYKTYLMRDPDQDGWNFWTSICESYGRGAVRQAFDESGEFHDIVASLSASGNPSSAVGSLATAQVDPFNQSGNQIQARDCEWSVPLISLPGRAGLDLGLNLSYSSLVWTRSGPYAYFDQDYESLSPGFTIGFPTIQWRKFDAQTGRNAYIFAAAGHHVELRQVGSTNIYEAANSSYLQLIDSGGSLSLRTTDGTELSFSPLLYGWNVTQIRDRNGNFITVESDWRGDVQHVTDTVGRTINFI
jgi:PKD repeat protein